MIRQFEKNDMEQVLKIWLEASIKAHDFVEQSFWESQLVNMREKYLPISETYVYEENKLVLGFISLYDDTIAAIFVSPNAQSQGIGKQLIMQAKKIRKKLNLKVYKSNYSSIKFYERCGFKVISEQVDENTGQLELAMEEKKFG